MKRIKILSAICLAPLLLVGCSANKDSSQETNESSNSHESGPINSGDLCGKTINITKDNILDYLSLSAGCSEIYNPYSTNTFELECSSTSIFADNYSGRIEENKVKYDCDVTVYYYDSTFTNILNFTFNMTDSVTTKTKELPDKAKVYEIKNEIKVNSASGYFTYSKQCHTLAITINAENYQNYLKISPMSFDPYNTNEDYRNHWWLTCKTNNDSLKFFGVSNLSFVVISSVVESGYDETSGQYVKKTIENEHILRCGSLLRSFLIEAKSNSKFYLKNVSGIIYLDSQLSFY